MFVEPKKSSAHHSEGSLTYSIPRYGVDFVTSTDNTNDTNVWSVNWKDASWRLNDSQHLGDTLIGLDRYLVLVSAESCGQKRIRVVIPDGHVSVSTTGSVDITVTDKIDDSLHYFVYNRHIRGRHLVCDTLSGRLHLAALYTATSTAGCDPCEGRPGFEVAVELIRQCWTTEALPLRDLEKLANVCKLARRQCAPLHALCVRLAKAQQRLHFLQFPGADHNNDTKGDTRLRLLEKFVED
jgi:hypothetical protein